jgi:hypothetical protein
MDKDTPLYRMLENAFNCYPIEAENYNFDAPPRPFNRFYQRPKAVARLDQKLH